MLNLKFRSLFLSAILFSQICMSGTAFCKKSMIVNRESGPWMKTVFVDAFYGSMIGGAGYGAYSLIAKDFQADAFGASVGVGFFVGMVVGFFDATMTDSSALVNYDKSTHQIAFSVPQTQIFVGRDSKQYGGQFRLLDLRF